MHLASTGHGCRTATYGWSRRKVPNYKAEGKIMWLNGAWCKGLAKVLISYRLNSEGLSPSLYQLILWNLPITLLSRWLPFLESFTCCHPVHPMRPSTCHWARRRLLALWPCAGRTWRTWTCPQNPRQWYLPWTPYGWSDRTPGSGQMKSSSGMRHGWSGQTERIVDWCWGSWWWLCSPWSRQGGHHPGDTATLQLHPLHKIISQRCSRALGALNLIGCGLYYVSTNSCMYSPF